MPAVDLFRPDVPASLALIVPDCTSKSLVLVMYPGVPFVSMMLPPVKVRVLTETMRPLMSRMPAELVSVPFTVRLLVTSCSVDAPLWLRLLKAVPPEFSV